MAGRKLIQINQQTFESLLKIHCTQEETAAVLGVSINTLKSWCRRTYDKSFGEVADLYRSFGRASLRRTLYKHAEKNPAACIFLCKNELGMSDTPKIEDTGRDEQIRTSENVAKALKDATAEMKKNGLKFGDLADLPNVCTVSVIDTESEEEE